MATLALDCTQMLPGGSVFGLCVVFAAAYVTGEQINALCPLVPTLVGQLVAGMSIYTI